MQELMNMHRRLAPAAAALIGVLELLALSVPGRTAQAATHVPTAQCDMRLRVELTPDVPNPRDAEFLSSLVRGYRGYSLTLQAQDLENASVVVVDLTGPGPEERCRQVVEGMRQDRRVWSVAAQQLSVSDAHTLPGTAQPAPDGQLRSEAACLVGRGYRVR